MPPDKKFIIVFTNYIIREVYASSFIQARIVAQAQNIKEGLGYVVDFIKDDTNRVVSRAGGIR